MSLKKNVIANYIGQGWISLMGIAFVPAYIGYLGMESYGLIGIFTLMQAWLTLLDMGMTPTLNREMARYLAGAHTTQSIRDLLRTLEVVCFSAALSIWAFVCLGSNWLAAHWLKVEVLSLDDVAKAISTMALLAALKFIENFYRSALIGLQQQVWLNVAGSGLATLRWAGAIAVLAWISPNIQAFFIWQGLVSALSVVLFVFNTYRNLPASGHPAIFSVFQLKTISRFAGGMMAQSLLVLLLMQVDKIILSRVLTLEMFGYYTLAGTVAAALYQLTTPITQAYFPRFSELVVQENVSELKKMYHHGAQLVSVMLVPAALMLMFFGERILALWTGNIALVNNVAPLLALLALGTMLNGLMHIPYMLTLAYGWSGFAVRVNIVAVTVLVPAIVWVSPRYGAIGAAWIWVLLNLGYLFLSTSYLYRRLLKTEMMIWYRQDLIVPASAATLTTVIFWQLNLAFSAKLFEILWITACSLSTLAVTALVTPSIRRGVLVFVCKQHSTIRL